MEKPLFSYFIRSRCMNACSLCTKGFQFYILHTLGYKMNTYSFHKTSKNFIKFDFFQKMIFFFDFKNFFYKIIISLLTQKFSEFNLVFYTLQNPPSFNQQNQLKTRKNSKKTQKCNFFKKNFFLKFCKLVKNFLNEFQAGSNFSLSNEPTATSPDPCQFRG